MARQRPRRAIPADASRPITVAAGAETLAQLVRDELAKLAKAKGTATHRQNQIKRCVATLKMLGELTGETLQMPESKVVKLPAFRRLVDVVTRALDPWPEAMVAVRDAIERAAGGGAAEKAGTT